MAETIVPELFDFSLTSDSDQFGMKSLDLCCSLQRIELNFSMTI